MSTFRSLGPPLLAALLLRALLSFGIPTGYLASRHGLSWYNDERAHANYVRQLAEKGRLPVQERSVQVPGAFQRGDFEYYQPPLSYLAQVPAWKFGETVRPGLGWLACRLLQALWGTAAIACAWLLARRIAPGTQGWIAWMLALQPGLCYQGSLCSNDPFFWLLGAVWLLLLPSPDGKGRLWPFFPLCTALLVSKSSAITLLPLPVLALLPPFSREPDLRRAARAAGWIALGALAAAPWYLRNHQLYGSWMALEVGHGAPWPLGETLARIQYPKMLLLYFETSLWYPMDMGWGALPVPRLLLALGSLAWIAPLAATGRGGSDARTRIAWAALALGVAAFVPYAIQYRQSEARLLFHLMPAFSVAWAAAAHRRPRLFGTLAIVPCVLVWLRLAWAAAA